MYVHVYYMLVYCFFFFKQKTAYEMRISDWSSDVCSSDLIGGRHQLPAGLNALDEDRLHSRARAIDRGGEPSGAGTEDEHTGRMGRHVAESASSGRGASRIEAPAVATWTEQARVQDRYAARKSSLAYRNF